MVTRKRLPVCKRKVLQHLKEDSQTWKWLAKTYGEGYRLPELKKLGNKEASADLKMIRELKRAKA